MKTATADVARIIGVLQLMKPLSQSCTLNTAIAFLTVASKPGVTVGDVQRALGLKPTSTCRALSILYERSRGIEGLNLVESQISLFDGRVKHLRLTKQGELLWQRIARIL
jgi:DNA-binding MarR family transcriptional regulator